MEDAPQPPTPPPQSYPQPPPPSPPPSPLPPRVSLPEGSGAKASRVCGILAVFFAVTCVGFPIAVILGIVSLVQHAKARRAALDEPTIYARPTNTGLVLGIVGLALSIIAIPTGVMATPIFLVLRDTKRGEALDTQFQKVEARSRAILKELEARQNGQPVEPPALIQAVLQDPELSALKSPLDAKQPLLEEAQEPSKKGVIALSASEEKTEDGYTLGSMVIKAYYWVLDEKKPLTATVTTWHIPPPVVEETPVPEEGGSEGPAGSETQPQAENP